MDWHTFPPQEIERESFAIITRELGDRPIPPEQRPIITRVIHTTADFTYADTLTFSPGAVDTAHAALRAGAGILTDTHMAQAGLKKGVLQAFGGTAHCFMSDPDVAKEASARGVTRAIVSMEKACALPAPLIVAIGNAPTALLRLTELIAAGQMKPALVIGAPVGFVNVIESKAALRQVGVPCIITEGRKGGSTVAAAICNALLLGAQTAK